MLTKTRFRANVDAANPELVVVELGNVSVKMDSHTALRLSQMIRVAGKQAKANACDALHWSVIAQLSDANA